MSFDGTVTKAVIDECQKWILKGRISKVYQPTDTDLILQIRSQGENKRLLLSANPTHPRMHFIQENVPNPTEPPMFCMLLRKYCEGAIIEEIKQIGMERVIHLDMRARDELGDLKTYRLIVEIMGRHSNLILLDVDRNLILDGINKVTPAMSRHRTVLPGREYIAPPEQNKFNPLVVNQETFISTLDFNAGKIDRQIVEHFEGISPLIAKEIVFRAELGNREKLWLAFSSVMTDIRDKHYHPQIVDNGERTYFSAIDLTHLTGRTYPFDSISECLEHYFFGKAKRDMVRQKAQDLLRFVSNEGDKNKKKLLKLEETLLEAENANQYQLYGELLTAYMHELKKGDKEATVVNYYDENAGMISIPLDPLKTPAENAQAYYRKYNKARNSQLAVNEQIQLTRVEIDYFENLLQQLENASLPDIEEIREELVEGGYIRNRSKKDLRKKKPTKPLLDAYLSSEGVPILVGKNNKQNDFLTNKFAAPTDTWLHTKDIPGSHVVIRAQEFSDQTLREAAMIAAYYSKARGSNQIPVDYTHIRHVKKPSGAKPGYVIYEHQKTIYVASDEQMVQKLKSN
jgi:predicted ribosome quality control (RQC) complex YloA/Tae2 family protein